MLNIPVLKRVLMRVLEERAATNHPRIAGRELYDTFSKQPEVIAYRRRHHRLSLPAETSTATSAAAADKGKKKASVETRVEGTLPPSRSFVRKVLLPRLLQTRKIERVHRKEAATEDDIARLSRIRTKSGATLLSRYKPGQPIVLSKWYFRVVPPPPSYVVPLPKKTPLMRMTAAQELELRRKTGEFVHLNRNKQKSVMEKALVEIAERKAKEREEWDEKIEGIRGEHAKMLAEERKEKKRLKRTKGKGTGKDEDGGILEAATLAVADTVVGVAT